MRSQKYSSLSDLPVEAPSVSGPKNVQATRSLRKKPPRRRAKSPTFADSQPPVFVSPRSVGDGDGDHPGDRRAQPPTISPHRPPPTTTLSRHSSPNAPAVAASAVGNPTLQVRPAEPRMRRPSAPETRTSPRSTPSTTGRQQQPQRRPTAAPRRPNSTLGIPHHTANNNSGNTSKRHSGSGVSNHQRRRKPLSRTSASAGHLPTIGPTTTQVSNQAPVAGGARPSPRRPPAPSITPTNVGNPAGPHMSVKEAASLMLGMLEEDDM